MFFRDALGLGRHFIYCGLYLGWSPGNHGLGRANAEVLCTVDRVQDNHWQEPSSTNWLFAAIAARE